MVGLLWLRMAAIRSWLELLRLRELSEGSWLWFPPSSFAWRSFTWWGVRGKDARAARGDRKSLNYSYIHVRNLTVFIIIMTIIIIILYVYLFITYPNICIYIYININIYRSYNPLHMFFSPTDSKVPCPCCWISWLDFAWVSGYMSWHDGTPKSRSDLCSGRGTEGEMKITKRNINI